MFLFPPFCLWLRGAGRSTAQAGARPIKQSVSLVVLNSRLLVVTASMRLNSSSEFESHTGVARIAFMFIDASWATCFEGMFLLKGYNSICVPTARRGSSVLWHLLVNRDGSRMTYSACTQHARLSSFTQAIFHGARHFIGWTANAEVIAGRCSSREQFKSQHCCKYSYLSHT